MERENQVDWLKDLDDKLKGNFFHRKSISEGD
jgi:hypothetical protein